MNPTPNIMTTNHTPDDGHVPVNQRPLEEQVEYWRWSSRRYEKALRAYKREALETLHRFQDLVGGQDQ